MRVACSASLRVTPLETRACLSVSPKTLIVTIWLPSPRRTNAQGPSTPYSIVPVSHRLDNRTEQWAIVIPQSHAGEVLRAAALLLRFRRPSIGEWGPPPVRRHIRGDKPDIVDGQPPITDCRLAWCRV